MGWCTFGRVAFAAAVGAWSKDAAWSRGPRWLLHARRTASAPTTLLSYGREPARTRNQLWTKVFTVYARYIALNLNKNKISKNQQYHRIELKFIHKVSTLHEFHYSFSIHFSRACAKSKQNKNIVRPKFSPQIHCHFSK